MKRRRFRDWRMSASFIEKSGLAHMYFEAVLAVRAPVLNCGSILKSCFLAQQAQLKHKRLSLPIRGLSE
jgi:hypothetical protein